MLLKNKNKHPPAAKSTPKSEPLATKDLRLDRAELENRPPPSTRHEAFALYIGPNLARYLHAFKAFEAVDETGSPIEEYAFTWHMPAFWFAPGWFLYRKLYGWAFFSLLTLLLPLIANLGWALMAYYIYYRHISHQIQIIMAQEPPQTQSLRLYTRGGVHAWVPTAGLITALLSALALLGGVGFYYWPVIADFIIHHR